MSVDETTPVILFTYNRPRRTAAVLQALRLNRPERLYVLQDGLKAGHDAEPHREVSRLLESIDFGRAQIVRRPDNRGLANSIISGVTQVLGEHETVVVLEDDCVPSREFLSFMSFALTRFRSEPRVFAVSGYALPAFPRDY